MNNKRALLLFLALAIAAFLVGGGVGIYTFSMQNNSDKITDRAFYSDTYNLKMYPPEGWQAKRDEYFGAEIMFLDGGQSHISDFASPNAIITLVPRAKNEAWGANTANELIGKLTKQQKETLDLAMSVDQSIGQESEDTKKLQLDYDRFLKAVENKYAVTVDGIPGTAYDWGSYFTGTGIGMTIIFVKDNTIYLLVAEAKDQNYWMENKDEIVHSMLSLKFDQG